jgi:U3 small nucleolar RNA-associated protein 22
LQQRGFATDESNGGFGSFEWTAVCASLLQGGGLNGRPLLSPQYDSYQLFKATLQFLAGDRFASPFLWKSVDSKVLDSSMPVFYDGVRGLNLTYKMSQWSYKRLRSEAQTTLAMLSDSKFDHFDSTFIAKSHEPLLRFDIVMKVPNLAKFRSTMDFQSQVYHVVSRSLGDRAKLVTLSSAITPSWPLQSTAPKTREKRVVTVGIILDPEHARRAVDHGPPAEEKEASAEFRDFWGEKAELRRFRDGSILESLVWLGESSAPPVVQQILLYALRRHLGKDSTKEVEIVGHQDELVTADDPRSADTMAPFQHFMEAFQALEKQLRDNDGLPVSLKQLSATDPQLRYTSIHSPSSAKNSTPAAVVIEFEGSGRWPDDLRAAQQTKTAFLLKIGELLEIATEGLVAKIGTENEAVPLVGNAFLDIVYPTGPSFRLRIHHDREQTFLARLLKDKSSNALLKQEASHALSAYKRTYLQAPRHAQAVRTLCTRFPYLSPTIRLFKTWCSAHLLSNHLAEELMELLVIRVFVQPFPWEAPSSTMAGFLRTLHMLSRWDWPREPLIIDSNGSLTPEEVTNMNARFQAWRKIDPAMNTMVLFVASNLDPDGVAWTQWKPLKVVAGRLSGLTKVAMNLVKDRGVGLDIKELFEPGLGDYDFVIHLKEKFRSAVPGRATHESSRFKNLQVRDVVDCDLVGYDPISQWLEELEQVHRNSIVFFYGGQGSSVIAGLWNPQMSFKPFRLKLTYSSAPMPEPEDENGEEMVSMNKPAILNEIASLGGDMVKRIEINRS